MNKERIKKINDCIANSEHLSQLFDEINEAHEYAYSRMKKVEEDLENLIKADGCDVDDRLSVDDEVELEIALKTLKGFSYHFNQLYEDTPFDEVIKSLKETTWALVEGETFPRKSKTVVR